MTLTLEVQQHEHQCVFTLRWGEGQQLTSASLIYPAALAEAYQRWQQAYLKFYQTFRGRVAETGRFSEVQDWRSRLVQTEAELLSEFHDWLRSKKLNEIRTQIAQTARELSEHTSRPAIAKSEDDNYLTLFLTCSSIELEQLPWEAWEIQQELGTTTMIRIARLPDRIRAKPIKAVRRGRSRVLVILGDDTGLDFKSDREAVQGLARIADIHFTGWQPGQETAELLSQITQAITDPQGWDLLLFAGHSNETAKTGGELAIAPGVSISISEIAPQLTIAKQHGLQFALFNSCSGLSIARSLIDFGFNQVAVMREPIHNKVAQEFLVQFLRSMAEYKDVHESLIAASRFLKVEKNLTYPSASLIPSLHCRPGRQPFRFRKVGWKEWMPSRRQAIALAGVAGLSVMLPIQGILLDQRLWTQARYRGFTRQYSNTGTPPIALVQIDEQSLQKAGIQKPNPINRAYLAKIIDRLAKLDVKVVGVDYLLDRPALHKAEDQAIAKSIQSAISQGMWLTFITNQDSNGKWATLLPNTENPQLALSHWSLLGNANLYGFIDKPRLLPAYLSLAYPGHSSPPPFSYSLALSKQLNATAAPDLPRPSLESQTDLFAQLVGYFDEKKQDLTGTISPAARLQLVTGLSYWFRQMWLHPLIDFSLPPDQVYQPIPAWQVLDGSLRTQQQQRLQHQVVILAPGGYEEAGIQFGDEDNMLLPAAVKHWRFWEGNRSSSSGILTGGEVHAYMLYQLLTNRSPIPIPDLWMILLFALLGKGAEIALQKRSFSRQQFLVWFSSLTTVYGLFSLQLYISVAILLPWLLPSVAFWINVSPLLKKQPHNESDFA